MATCDSRVGFAFNNPDTSNDYHAPNWGYLVSPDELRYDELFGNILIAEADSQSITNNQLLDYVRLAIRYLEVELNIDILPRRIRYHNSIDLNGNEIQRTDFDDSEFLSKMTRKQKKELYIEEDGYPYKTIAVRREARVKLRRRPLRDVLTANFVDQYFGEQLIDLMPFRLVKKNFTAVCHFRPRSFSAIGLSYSELWSRFLYRTENRNLQDIFRIDYDTGYENCEDVPDEFRNIVKKISAVTLMNIYGDGKLAAIASKSVSLNGVSESINTTLSATSATFGARIIQYQKEIKTWLGQNRSKYSRTTIGKL